MRATKVFVAFVILLVTVMSLAAFPAAALTWARYPPYAGSFYSWNIAGGYGNYEVYQHWVESYASDGTIQFHLKVDTGPPAGAANVNGRAGFTGSVLLTPILSGWYTISYYFTVVSGNVQMYTMLPPWPGTTQVTVQFKANLYDQTSYALVSNGDVATTVYSGIICCGGAWFQDLSGNNYQVRFTAYLVAGHTYSIWGYKYGEIQVNWPYEMGWADGEIDMSSKMTSVTAYIPSTGGCVWKGTPVLTPNGYVKIEKLKKGDAVLSYDVASGRLIRTNVESIVSYVERNIVNINNGTLFVTPYDQPIYMKNSTFEGWLRNPGELVSGDYVFDATSGEWVLVSSILQTSGKFNVYDLRTSGPNNYIANGILLDAKVPLRHD